MSLVGAATGVTYSGLQKDPGPVCDRGTFEQVAFNSSIAWREYAGYLETELSKLGKGFVPIANNVLRTTPPVRVRTIIYE